MHFRHFDPAIARWTSVDPVPHFDLSPYNGMDNSPIVGVDPSGADVIQINGGIKFTGADAVEAFKIIQQNAGGSNDEEGNDEKDCCGGKKGETLGAVIKAGFLSLFGFGDAAIDDAIDAGADIETAQNLSAKNKKAAKERNDIAEAIKDGLEAGDLLGVATLLANLQDGEFGLDDGINLAAVLPGGKFLKGGKILKPLLKGSTGRTIAKSLTEQLAMAEILTNPQLGRVIKQSLSDPRWKGWAKLTNEGAHGVEIHFNAQIKNGKIINVDDFKFID